MRLWRPSSRPISPTDTLSAYIFCLFSDKGVLRHALVLYPEVSPVSPKNRCIVEMLLCACLWSTGGIFMKFVPWNPMLLSGARSLVAGAVIAVYMLLFRHRFIIDKKTLSAGTALACTYTFFVIANKLTTAANAIVLQFTAPIFIVLLSAVFLRTRFARRDIAAVLLTLVGISMFFLDQLTPGGLLGNLSGLAAGISMAAMYIINGESAGDERLSAILISQTLCFALGLPFLFAGGVPEVTPAAVGSVLFLGAIQLGFPYILYARAAELCPPLACCLLGAAEPLLNPLWVFIFDGERPGTMALIGGAVVVFTITAWSAAGAHETNPEAV